MSPSFISNECDDSSLLLLSELLTTFVAFFPTKGELTLLCKSLEKRGLSTSVFVKMRDPEKTLKARENIVQLQKQFTTDKLNVQLQNT